MQTTIFYLVRHGETEWNREGRWQGHADVPLSEQGQIQAERLAQRLAHEQVLVDQIYASDLSRAWETAQIAARPLNLPVRACPELQELDVGSWSGLTREQIVAQFPGAFVSLRYAPDGEQGPAFRERVTNITLRLAQEHQGQRLMLVTHGGVIRTLLGRVYDWHNQPNADVPPITNTSITELQLHNGIWHIERISDGAHLGSEQEQEEQAPRNESMVPR